MSHRLAHHRAGMDSGAIVLVLDRLRGAKSDSVEYCGKINVHLFPLRRGEITSVSSEKLRQARHYFLIGHRLENFFALHT